MASLSLLAVLAGLLLVSNAAPEFRRQEPQESEPVFTTAVYPISEEPQNTPDEYTGVPEYWYPTPDYTNDTDSDYYQTPSYFPDYSTPEYDSNYTNYPSYYNEVPIVCGLGSDERYTYVVDGSVYTISTANSTDGYYENNQNCVITFETVYETYFSIYLEKLDFEYDYECRYDSVCIGGTKFCGYWEDNNSVGYTVPANTTFTLKIKTDATITGRGANIILYTAPSTGYGYTYEPTNAYATSASSLEYRYVSTEDYQDICTLDNYGHTTPDYYGTNNDFIYYPTQGYTGSTDDPLDAYSQVVECGNDTSYNYYFLNSNTNSYDNSYDGYSGYYGRYFGGNNNNNRYIIRTPNYGSGSYSGNVNCQTVFYTGSTPQIISVHYRDFDLESSDNCRWDSFCAGVKLCGSWPTGRYQSFLVDSYRSFTVSFNSDGSVSGRGADVVLTSSDYTSGYAYYEPSGGDGSSESSIDYSYQYLNSYQDRCANDNYDQTTYAPYTTPRGDGPGDAAFEFEQIHQYVQSLKASADLIDNAAVAGIVAGKK